MDDEFHLDECIHVSERELESYGKCVFLLPAGLVWSLVHGLFQIRAS